MWIVLQSINIQSLLKIAKEQEKRYEWLQAAKTYKKAIKSYFKVNKLEETGKIKERIGYCFFRAALQAKTNKQFKTRMRLASKNYEQTFLILQDYDFHTL